MISSGSVGSLRRRSLLAFALVFVVPVLVTLILGPSIDHRITLAIVLISILSGVIVSLTLRCPNCTRLLSVEFMPIAGATLFLWAVRQPCPKCRIALYRTGG